VLRGLLESPLFTLASVASFLLLASANVASLLLARTSVRSRELVIRLAIGASRARLARLLVTESLVIAAAGTLIGLWIGTLGAELLWSLRSDGIARVDSVALDTNVVLFTVAVSVFAAVLFGLAPLAAVSKLSPVSNLKTTEGPGQSGRAREWVVVAEVAIGLVLVVGAGLLAQTLSRLITAGGRLRQLRCRDAHRLTPVAAVPGGF